MRDARRLMLPTVDRLAIAARLRALVHANDLAETARRLGVSESELQHSLDDVAAHPTTDVLVAVVREYGVDPTWLAHGEYNRATHYAALEEGDVTPITLLGLAGRLGRDRSTGGASHGVPRASNAFRSR